MIELHGRIDPVKHLQGTMKAVAGDVYDVPPVVIEPKLQAKTATPTGENQKIVPDDGYNGLSSVTVNAVLLQAKSVTPTKEDQYVQPDSGYSGLSIVEVKGFEVNKISDISISEETGTFTITFEGGTGILGVVTFDDAGIPVTLIDNAGNTVEFSDGHPSRVTDSDGHTVSIQWG